MTNENTESLKILREHAKHFDELVKKVDKMLETEDTLRTEIERLESTADPDDDHAVNLIAGLRIRQNIIPHRLKCLRTEVDAAEKAFEPLILQALGALRMQGNAIKQEVRSKLTVKLGHLFEHASRFNSHVTLDMAIESSVPYFLSEVEGDPGFSAGFPERAKRVLKSFEELQAARPKIAALLDKKG